jgi:acyl-CoA reductase-like NAD-dependent aldehyde dehydrogenase
MAMNATVPLRPASTVMSPTRAGATVANALSFSRSAMRELVRGRYRIEKIRFDLDGEGRGEILYRLVGGYKQSGNGREWGEFGVNEFLEIKGIQGYAPS